MATKIAAINGKGGCAKTTSLYHLTGVLANQGKKILAVDFDKQCNFSSTLLMHSEKPELTVYDMLINRFDGDIARGISPALFKSRGNAYPKHYGVDVMAGDIRLENSDMLQGLGSEELTKNFDALTQGYDFVLMDMPPSSKALNEICLGYLADYVIVPFSSDLYSISGYGDIMDTVSEARETNPDLSVLGVYLSRYMGYCGVDRYIREQLLGLENFIDIQIPLAADVREAVMYGRPISYYKADSNSRRAYEALSDEIERRVYEVPTWHV